MSARELVVLGTGSQVPTRERNQNGYFLRWDQAGFLFDPGEGTQRQLTLAGIPAGAVDCICITHFHGDHCLGLAGVLQRLSLDHCDHAVRIFYPAAGQEFFERLRSASIYRSELRLEPRPIMKDGAGFIDLVREETFYLQAHALEHSVPCCGFRLEEPAGRRFLSDRLAALGISGPTVGELARTGSIESGGRTVRLEEVTAERQGSVFAFVMDTRPCEGAAALARDADLAVMEATYTDELQALAEQYGHMTARSAAEIASAAGVHRLALTHFSQRYTDSVRHLAEARGIFPETIALEDLDRIAIPRR